MMVMQMHRIQIIMGLQICFYEECTLKSRLMSENIDFIQRIVTWIEEKQVYSRERKGNEVFGDTAKMKKNIYKYRLIILTKKQS